MIKILGVSVVVYCLFLLVLGILLFFYLLHGLNIEGFQVGTRGSGSGSGSGSYMTGLTRVYVKDCSRTPCFTLTTDTDRLTYLQRLPVGGRLVSANGRYTLVYIANGILALYDMTNLTTMWMSDTTDGNRQITPGYIVNFGNISAYDVRDIAMPWRVTSAAKSIEGFFAGPVITGAGNLNTEQLAALNNSIVTIAGGSANVQGMGIGSGSGSAKDRGSGSGSSQGPLSILAPIPSSVTNTGCYLQVTNYGDLAIFSSAGSTLWSANTGTPPKAPLALECTPSTYGFTTADCGNIAGILASNKALINSLTVVGGSSGSGSGSASGSQYTSLTSVAGLQLWLDALEPQNNGERILYGNPVKIWYDKSGAGNNLTQTNSMYQPLFYTNYLRFHNNRNMVIPTAVMNGLSSYSIFMVLSTASLNNIFIAKQNDNFNGTVPFLLNNGTTVNTPAARNAQNVLSSGITPNNAADTLELVQFNQTFPIRWRSRNYSLIETDLGVAANDINLIEIVYSGSSSSIYVNGTLKLTNSTEPLNLITDNSPTSYLLGGWYSTINQSFYDTASKCATLAATLLASTTHWDSTTRAKIAAQNTSTDFNLYGMAVYTRGVSNSERQFIEGYMAQAYGIQSVLPASHPYKTWTPVPNAGSSGSSMIVSRSLEMSAANTSICMLQPVYDSLRCASIVTGPDYYTGTSKSFLANTVGGATLTVPQVRITGSIANLSKILTVTANINGTIRANDIIYLGYVVDLQGPFVAASVSTTQITLTKVYVGPSITNAIISVVASNGAGVLEFTPVVELGAKSNTPEVYLVGAIETLHSGAMAAVRTADPTLISTVSPMPSAAAAALAAVNALTLNDYIRILYLPSTVSTLDDSRILIYKNMRQEFAALQVTAANALNQAMTTFTSANSTAATTAVNAVVNYATTKNTLVNATDYRTSLQNLFFPNINIGMSGNAFLTSYILVIKGVVEENLATANSMNTILSRVDLAVSTYNNPSYTGDEIDVITDGIVASDPTLLSTVSEAENTAKAYFSTVNSWTLSNYANTLNLTTAEATNDSQLVVIYRTMQQRFANLQNTVANALTQARKTYSYSHIIAATVAAGEAVTYTRTQDTTVNDPEYPTTLMPILFPNMTPYPALTERLTSYIDILKTAAAANLATANRMNTLVERFNSAIRTNIPTNATRIKNIQTKLFNGGSIFTQSQASAVCSAFGGTVATVAQLTKATNQAASWCTPGWLADGTTRFPVQSVSDCIGYTGTATGVAPWVTTNGLAGVVCYGVKPEKGSLYPIGSSSPLALPYHFNQGKNIYKNPQTIYGSVVGGTNYITTQNGVLPDSLSIGEQLYIQGQCNPGDRDNGDGTCTGYDCPAGQTDNLDGTCQTYTCLDDTTTSDGTCYVAEVWPPCKGGGEMDGSRMCINDITTVIYGYDDNQRLLGRQSKNQKYLNNITSPAYTYNVVTYGKKGSSVPKTSSNPSYIYPKRLGPYSVALTPTVNKIIIKSKNPGDLNSSLHFNTVSASDKQWKLELTNVLPGTTFASSSSRQSFIDLLTNAKENLTVKGGLVGGKAPTVTGVNNVVQEAFQSTTPIDPYGFQPDAPPPINVPSSGTPIGQPVSGATNAGGPPTTGNSSYIKTTGNGRYYAAYDVNNVVTFFGEAGNPTTLPSVPSTQKIFDIYMDQERIYIGTKIKGKNYEPISLYSIYIPIAADSSAAVNAVPKSVGLLNVTLYKGGYDSSRNGSQKISMNKKVIGCPEGTGGPLCTPCLAGTTSTLAGLMTTSCAACPVNKYCLGGVPAKPCEVGYVCTPTGVTPCTGPAGTYCPVGAREPIGCPPGYYCVGGIGSSIQCRQGYYCVQGSSAETECDAGYYCSAGSGYQEDCPSGFYCPTRRTIVPSVCPETYMCPPRSTSGTSNKCPAGSYCAAGTGGSPPTCPAGRYCPEGTGSRPPECSAGTFCTTGKSTNDGVICTRGTYCPQGTITMAPCPAGRYCPTAGMGATPAPLCDAGFYCTEGTVEKSQQISCGMGNYCPQGSATQIRCPAGTRCPHPSYTVPCSGTYVCPEGTVGSTILPSLPNNGMPTPCPTKVSVAVTSFYKFPSSNISPSNMAIDYLGNIFVSVYRSIYKITPEGVATTLVTLRDAGGPIGGMDFYYIGTTPILYFTTPSEHNIYKVDMSGNYTLVAGTGTSGFVDNAGVDNVVTNAIPQFNYPMDIKREKVGGGFFISDYHNGAIRYMMPDIYINNIRGQGAVVRTIVNIQGPSSPTFRQNINGDASTAQLRPTYMAVTQDDILYILDQYDKNIVKKYVRSGTNQAGGTVSIYAGASDSGTSSAPLDGNGTNAKFGDMMGIAVDLVGNVYISELGIIRMIDPNRNVKTIAGVSKNYGDINGVASIVPANTDPIAYPSGTNRASPIPKIAPSGICVHPTGDVYFSEMAPYSSIRRLMFSCGSYKNGVLTYAFSFENSDKLEGAAAPTSGAATPPSGGAWTATFA